MKNGGTVSEVKCWGETTTEMQAFLDILLQDAKNTFGENLREGLDDVSLLMIPPEGNEATDEKQKDISDYVKDVHDIFLQQYKRLIKTNFSVHPSPTAVS